MRHIELHILQSFPVACLNRDDFGSPKTAVFGGVLRARVSSQCWKRASRMFMAENARAYFKGLRTRFIIEPLRERLEELPGFTAEQAQQGAEALGDAINKLDNPQKRTKTPLPQEPENQISALDRLAAAYAKHRDLKKALKALAPPRTPPKKAAAPLFPAINDSDQPLSIINHLRGRLEQAGFTPEDAQKSAEDLDNAINMPDARPERIKTLFFTSPLELDTLATVYAKNRNAKEALNAVAKTVCKDAADIALFGRMVANDHTLTVEGAAMFGHALSTHRTSNEIDFFSAVDDRNTEDAGAAITGTLEFNSATYYRFAALNLDMLADPDHLGALMPDERRQVVRMFMEAVIRAVPTARHNSMNAATLPSFVLVVVREKGHPVQLVNAFEEPVWSPKGGLVAESRKKLEEEYANLQKVWGITADTECRIPDMPLNKVLEEVVKHVV